MLVSCEQKDESYLDLTKYLHLNKMKKQYEKIIQVMAKHPQEGSKKSPSLGDDSYSDIMAWMEDILAETQLHASIYETIKAFNLLKKSHKTYQERQTESFLENGIESYVKRPIEQFQGDKLIIGTGWNPKYFCETSFYLEWAEKQGNQINLDLSQPHDQGLRLSKKEFNQCLKDIEKIKKTYYSIDIDPIMEPDFLASAVNPIHMSYFPPKRFSYILFDYFPSSVIVSPLVWENTDRLLKPGGRIKIITAKALSILFRSTLMQTPWAEQIKNRANISNMELIKK